VQAEVLKMTGNNPRTDTIYEVFLPSTSYSSDGTYTSCGGPRLTYCAYHGNFGSPNHPIIYANMPTLIPTIATVPQRVSTLPAETPGGCECQCHQP